MVDASERLQVLLSQEESIYKTTDYLARIHAQMQQPAVALGTLDPAVASAAQARSVSSSSPKKRKSSWDDEDNSGEQSSPPAGQQCASADDAAGTEGSSSTQINKHWREKICEWAYQGTSLHANYNTFTYTPPHLSNRHSPFACRSGGSL
mmetsp:Transcript_26188/g.46170  ORF Transcript_26188/g.46170 Transcript_26188/m.46170 type:complete len:150 (-) Transcript_26188:976-1425(-)